MHHVHLLVSLPRNGDTDVEPPIRRFGSRKNAAEGVSVGSYNHTQGHVSTLKNPDQDVPRQSQLQQLVETNLKDLLDVGRVDGTLYLQIVRLYETGGLECG